MKGKINLAETDFRHQVFGTPAQKKKIPRNAEKALWLQKTHLFRDVILKQLQVCGDDLVFMNTGMKRVFFSCKNLGWDHFAGYFELEHLCIYIF